MFLKENTQTVKLGDKEYKLSPVNWNVLSAIEDEFGNYGEISKQLETKPVTTLRTLTWIFLSGQLTKEQIGALITPQNQEEISNALTECVKELINAYR